MVRWLSFLVQTTTSNMLAISRRAAVVQYDPKAIRKDLKIRL